MVHTAKPIEFTKFGSGPLDLDVWTLNRNTSNSEQFLSSFGSPQNEFESRHFE